MRFLVLTLSMVPLVAGLGRAVEPPVLGTPDLFKTLVNPTCSHCRDEAVRRAVELKPGDRVLAWTRGYSDGGAIPFRFFLNAYPVISDSYGVFVADPDAGFARGFAPSYEFRAHGWRNGVMVMAHKDGTLYSCLTGVAFDGPKKGTRLTPVPTVVSDWGWWLGHYPDAVAYHFQQSGDDRALEWLVKAGERAQRAYAWVTAEERYKAALALMEGGEADERERGWLLYRLAGVDRFDDARAAAYFNAVHQIATRTGEQALFAISLFWNGYHNGPDIRRGLAEMEQSIALLTALSPTDRARIVAYDSIEIFDEEYIKGRYYARLVGTGRYAKSLEWAEQSFPDLLSDDTAESPRSSLGHGYRGLGNLYAALGRPNDARQAFTLAREALEARGNFIEAGVAAMWELTDVIVTYQTDDLIRRQRVADTNDALWGRAVDYRPDLPTERAQLPLMFVDGRWSEARSVAHAMFAGGGFIRPYGSLRIPVIAVAREQGDLPIAQQLIAETFPAGLETDQANAMGFRGNLITQCLAAALAIDMGDLPTAHAWLEMHDRWLAWSSSVFGQADGALGWARYHRAAGDTDLAHHYAMNALALATNPRQPLAQLAAHRLLGELETGAQRFDAAASHLETALALADACAAPYERALTLLAMAEHRAATHAHAEALLLLDEVRILCTPLGAKPALARADALAARLVASRETVTYPAGLSTREVEVLRLIAAGRTNREIADALFIAEKTVERHITHILTKTESANRAAAVVFAMQHDLV